MKAFLKTISFIALIALTAKVNGQAPFYVYNYGSSMATYNQALDTVVDDQYSMLSNPLSGWQNNYFNYESQNLVRLFVDDANTTPVAKFSYNFLVKVTRWSAGGTQSTFNVTIPLSYDPDQYKPYRDVSVYRFKGAHKFTCNILSVTDATTGSSVSIGSLKKKFGIYMEIKADRYEKSSYNDIVSSSDLTHSTATPGKININWSGTVVKAPTWFELEWMHVDDYGGNYRDFLNDYTLVHQDFNTNGNQYGWNQYGGSVDVTDGTMNLVGDMGMMHAFSIVPGRRYRAIVKIKSLTSGKQIVLKRYHANGTTYTESVTSPAGPTDASLELEFDASETTFNLGIENYVGSTCKIDDVYLLDIEYEPSAGQPYYTPAEKLAFNFRNNATRVRLDDVSYTIDDVFEHGYLLYRVRRVRPDSVFRKHEKFSSWSDNTESGYVIDYSDYLATGAHIGDSLNWNYQVSYAEEGKRKDMVGYYDGLLKPRQQVAASSSDNTVIVGESKYDFSGRAAVQILPVPAVKDTGYHNRIRYYEGFNRNMDDVPYSASDFDSLEAACLVKGANPLSSDYGASRYYSENNPNKSDFHRYVPDAKLYPMVQTEYMPDNTGRVRRQGGVGADHQLGSRHETFYDYSQPGQAELERLFGSEVGMASHYKKQTVTDANGQVSVSYTDMSGKVIATGLLGASPDNLDALPENRPGSIMVNNIGNKNERKANGLELTFEHTVSKSGPIYVDYRMQSSAFRKACMPVELCYKCVYNYELTLINKGCNEVVFRFLDTIGYLNPLDTLCGTLANVNLLNHLETLQAMEGSIDTGMSMIMIPDLDTGTYALIKRLYVNPNAAGKYFERYLGQTGCVRSFDVFFQQALDSTDFSGCDPCDTCSDGSDMGYCDAMLDLMKSDVSPGGQYCQYADTNGYIFAIDTPTSVLQLARYKSIKAYSTRDSIDLIVLADGSIDSAYKADVHTFITQFKTGWADSLVKFHPEYPFYLYCRDYLTPSFAYDMDRHALTSYDTAWIYGYMNPTGIVGLKLGFPTDTPGRDPYFKNNPALRDAMNSRLLCYKIFNDTVYTIWDMAALQTFCAELTDPLEMYACVQAFRDRRVVDSIFFNPALRDQFMQSFQTLYTGIKQVIIDSMLSYAPGIYANITPGFNYPTCYVGETGGINGGAANYCNDYVNKIRRFYSGYSDGLDHTKSDTDLGEDIKNRVKENFNNDSTCYRAALKWIDELAECPFRPSLSEYEYNAMRDSMVALCQRGRAASTVPSLFPVTTLPADYPGVAFRNMQQLLNYFYGPDSVNATTMLACSPSIFSNSFTFNHSFTDNQAKSECQCLKDSVIVPARVIVQDSTETTLGGRCIRTVSTLNWQGWGLKDLLNSIMYKRDTLRGRNVTDANPNNDNYNSTFWDTGYAAYKTYFEPHGFIYELIGSNEFKTDYKGALASRNVHQWRLNFSDSADVRKQCNVFFNINAKVANMIFTGNAYILGFEKVSWDTFNVLIVPSGFVGVDVDTIRFKGFSNCLRLFTDSCVESTTDTLYGTPYVVDSTLYDSFMVMARAIRNGTADSLMGNFMAGGECDDGLGGGGCGTFGTGKTQYLVDVMNEALYTGREKPGAFNHLLDNRSSFWQGIPDGETYKFGYYNYTMDDLSPTYVEKFALDWSRYDGYRPHSRTFIPNPANICYDIRNVYADPYFIGILDFGIGYGENNEIINCNLSFGDPEFKNINLSEIDSFMDFRMDPVLGVYVVTAIDRYAVNIFDPEIGPVTLYTERYIKLTVRSCFDPGPCTDFAGTGEGFYKRIYMEEDNSYKYKYTFECQDMMRFYEEGHDYMCNDNSMRQSLLDSAYAPMFLENMLNDKARQKQYYDYDGTVPNMLAFTNYPDTFTQWGIPPAMDALMEGYKYSVDYLGDSMMIIYLGDTGQLSGCQLTLRFLEGDSLFTFSGIDSFYRLRPDEEKLREYFLAGNLEGGRHYFTVNAFKDSVNQYNYKLRGWLSCVPVFNCAVPVISAEASAKDTRCGCATCPEVKYALDSFMAVYDTPAVNVEVNQRALTGFLNTTLNNNLTWTEYESFMAKCRLFDLGEHRVAEADYRIRFNYYYTQTCMNALNAFISSQEDSFGYSVSQQWLRITDDTIELNISLASLPQSEHALFLGKLNYFLRYGTSCMYYYQYATPYPSASSSCGITIMAYDSSSCAGALPDKLDTLVGLRFDIEIPEPAAQQVYDPLTYSFNTTRGYVRRWCLDLSSKTMAEKKTIYKVIDSLLAHCSEITFTSNFNVREAYSLNENDTMCMLQLDTNYLTSKGTVCESCNGIYDKLLKYQQQVFETKPELVREAMLPEQSERHLRNWYGLDVQVSEMKAGTPGAEKQTFVCAPTEKAHQLVGVLRAVDKLGSFYSSNVNLGNDTFASIIDTAGGNAYYSGILTELDSNSFTFTFLIAQDGDTCRFSLTGDTLVTLIDTIFGIESLAGNGNGFTLITGSKGLVNSYTVSSNCDGFSQCCSFVMPKLCFRSYFETIPPDTGACRRQLTEIARSNALEAYKLYTDSVKLAFENEYNTFCLDSATVKEKIGVGYEFAEYHYTLYYYDLAGNLLKTVPPAGVDTLDITQSLSTQLDNNRKNYQAGTHVHTHHTLATTYRYNSLGQVRWQKTPDAGESKFYYDLLGRLVLSQNSVQAARGNVYSYTIRDAMNRVTEVGEITSTAVHEDSLKFHFKIYYTAWLGRGTRTQITRTYYDKPYSTPVSNLFAGGQKYLRNRVSSVAYFETNSASFTYATHYSYDIHGNVDVLLQDYPELQDLGNRYKYLYYNYDLVSGKVNMVRYQPGQPDRFYHKYQYDADNRLTHVLTSSDSVIWDDDAAYTYYKHGPLARTELGGKNVQGIDYAYTIHGWLKGVNSGTLDSTRDMGGDASSNTSFASDVFGFTLGYYNGDYKPIDNNYYNTSIAFAANIAGSPLANRGLYNGNISSMVQAVKPLMTGNKPMANIFEYDQLNRITRMETYTDVNMSTNAWNSGTPGSEYLSTFGYDPNGNIKYLFRNGLSNTMDSLHYNYYAGTNQLKHVNDNVSAGTYGDDIDNQSAGNYKYDRIGNLAKDSAEQIDTLLWNVYGKIRHIKRMAGSTRPGLEFRYDASGQRVLKIVKNGASENNWTKQYYVRDAQGNIMATYQAKSEVSDDDLNIAAITDWIVTNQGNNAFASLMVSQFVSDNTFIQPLIPLVESNGLYEYLYDSYYTPQQLLSYDAELVRSLMIFLYDNNWLWEDLVDKLGSLSSYEFNDLVMESVRNAVQNDPALMEELLIALLRAEYDANTTNMLLQICGMNQNIVESIYVQMGLVGLPLGVNFPCVLFAQEIMWANRHEELAGYMLSYISAEPMWNIVVRNGMSQAEIMNAFRPSNGYINDFVIFLVALNYADAGQLQYFFMSYYGDEKWMKEAIYENNPAAYVLNVMAMADPYTFIYESVSANPTMVNEILQQKEDFTVAKYMELVRDTWGQDAYESLAGSLLYNQRFKLSEHHLYGSSRLGVKNVDTTLFQREISINGFDSQGNMLVDDVLDSSKLQVDTAMHYYMLARKQYELANHLGNVLATVSDRRTQLSSGYKADVLNATYYYPFGSPMPGKTFDHRRNILLEGDFSSTQLGWVIGATQTLDNGRLKVMPNSPYGRTRMWMFDQTVAGKYYTFTVMVDKGTTPTISLNAQNYDEYGVMLGQTIISSNGRYTLRFKATGPTTLVTVMTESYASGQYFFIDDLVVEEDLSGEGPAYAFGFNGQERDNEVAGDGNSYTAEYWQYDSRLGRRFNVDPVVKVYESPYACFANNPIFLIDPQGSDTFNIDNGGVVKSIIKAAGNHIIIDHNKKQMQFNDPEYDTELINKRKVNVGDKLIYYMSEAETKKRIDGQGKIEERPLFLTMFGMPVFNPNFNIITAFSKIKDMSYKEWDFSHSVLGKLVNADPNSNLGKTFRNGVRNYTDDYQYEQYYFFVFGNDTKVYNMGDAGNFMWGAASGRSGFTYLEIKMGSNWNELKQLRGFDSDADQRAIEAGFDF